MFSNTKALAIPEGNVVQIDVDGVTIWKAGYKNWVLYSTEADGKTIYNGGKGYKDEYRIRSGGAEAWKVTASHTGYITLKGGNIVLLSGYNAAEITAENAINVYDGSHNNIGQIVSNYPNAGYGIFQTTYSAYGWKTVAESPSGVFVWQVPPSAEIAYMRVTGFTYGDGSKMIVTVNEEITL